METALFEAPLFARARPLIDRARRVLNRWVHPAHFGTLQRTEPLSQRWGYDRGLPIDRHYIECFVGRNRRDVRGRVLEVGDTRYTRRFGDGRISIEHVLDLEPRAGVTLAMDLSGTIPEGAGGYDCFVLVQTLQYVADVPRALANARALLRPGGVLLCTVPALARVDPGVRAHDRWRFTAPQCERWLAQSFGEPGDAFSIEPMGNVLSACASLQGLAAQDLSADELAHTDADFPVLLGIRAVRGPR